MGQSSMTSLLTDNECLVMLINVKGTGYKPVPFATAIIRRDESVKPGPFIAHQSLPDNPPARMIIRKAIAFAVARDARRSWYANAGGRLGYRESGGAHMRFRGHRVERHGRGDGGPAREACQLFTISPPLRP